VKLIFFKHKFWSKREILYFLLKTEGKKSSFIKMVVVCLSLLTVLKVAVQFL